MDPAPASIPLPAKSRLHAADPVRWALLGGALLALLVLVVYPLTLLLIKSFSTKTGEFTLGQYQLLLSRADLYQALWNSLRLAGWTTSLSLLLGVPMAWLVARTNIPGKTLIRALVPVSFIIPSYILALAWIILLGPNAGKINVFMRDVLHLPFTMNIFTFSGLVLVETLHFFPLVFATVSAALNNMDSSYEEAARVCGAGKFGTALRVTLPVVTPAIVSGAMLVFLDTLASFGAPASIGFSAGFHVLTTKIYQLVRFPPQFELASAAAAPIIILTALALGIQWYILGRRQFVTVSGKSIRPSEVDLGPWKWVAAAFCFLVLGVSTVLPVTYLVLTSFVRIWGMPFTWGNFTLANYAMLLDPSLYVMSSIKNSFVLALGAATLTVLIGTLIVWMVERMELRGKGLLIFLVMVPFAFPAMTMGIGFILAFAPLWGTLWILLFGYVAKQLPLAFTFGRDSLKQISKDLEEAGRMVGASWARTFQAVTIPLLRSGLVAAWVLIFSLSLRELSMSALLSLPGTETMAVAMFLFLEDGDLEKASALAILISLLSVGSVLVVQRGKETKGGTL